MKKMLLLSILSFFFCGFSVSTSFSQNTKQSSLTEANFYSVFEEEWIEVMFSAESKVRMRDGNLSDLATQALQGVDQVLSKLSWYQWHRMTDVPESTIDSWETTGERNTGKDIYNLNNIYRLQIPKGCNTSEIAERLEALPGIYFAKPVPKPVELPSPPPGSFQSQQGYLNPAVNNPSGVDALYAWTRTGGTGTGITICDLEYSWNYNHADVTKALGSQINTNISEIPGGNNNHGTAVVGELVANNNGWGTTGICYGSNLKTCGTYYGFPTPTWNVAGAIALAVNNLIAGDIILLEQQWEYSPTQGTGWYIPIEWWGSTYPNPQINNPVYAAIVNAIANGIHVVEAGGNGNYNTGTLTWYGNSGAIIVGAGGATTTNDRNRLSFSSYGPRFDMQGWGENVVTTGYGTLYNAEGANYYYTATFNGTSSASPVVAGAFACAEGFYLANISATPPTPSYLRTYMATWGTPQTFGIPGNIGPRPDIKTAILNWPLATLDFGDAPDLPYPTKLATNGARHTNTGLRLGILIDSELDGQPDGSATGDDINPPAADDEDGVSFTSAITPGQLATVQVTASAPGILNAWIDFNMINVWSDAGEFIFQNVPLIAGINNLSFPVPANALPGLTFARFRFNSQGGLLFYGPASDGEVEDHQVYIEENEEFDWGDAPDIPYPTLGASGGANHMIDGITYLGALIDAEPDGQPEPMALGDDLDIFYPPPNDDEDGVVFLGPLIPNQGTGMNVTASVQGFLNVWIDFNLNGFWGDPGEQIFTDVLIPAGLNAFAFLVPANATPGNTFARFRFSTVQGLGFAGAAPNGEVEDYQLNIEQVEDIDWGDAPDGPYPTRSANNGANHKLDGITYLGPLIDAEPDGQPDPQALGDDLDILYPPPNDDEDGIWWPCNFTPGHVNTVKVNASVPGFLNAWFDFNFDGDWTDPGEQVFTNVALLAGYTDLNVSVPVNAFLGNTFARFRFSTQLNLSFTGQAQDGEVEDYMITIQESEEMDYGDAPDPTYPTLAGSNGARHFNDPAIPIFLGNLIDWELDGQPSPNADGDDLNMLPDEDGVVLNTPIIPGFQAFITVTASIGGGGFQGWIDFNQDGDWMDPGEQIFNNVMLVAGPQPLNFIVPANALLGNTYARYRYSTMGNLMPYGCAPNGEVEDYLVLIGEPDEFDWGDLPDPLYPTLAASNGPNHKVGPLFLGNLIDSEINGQPHPAALGDDLTNLPDEDGVVFTSNIMPGQVASVTIGASQGGGLLQGWIDLNADGDFNDAGEQIFTNQVLPAGNNPLTFTVNPAAQVGPTFARFRLSTVQGLGYTLAAPNGEVEDYSVMIVPAPEPEMDWGDAPDTTYPTLLVNNGARHLLDGITYLGTLIDQEPDGQPTLNADGDDLNNIDDEDGVIFMWSLAKGNPCKLKVTASVGDALFNCWIDFNGNGSWAEPNEHVFMDLNLLAGDNYLTFITPQKAIPGPTYARFRFSHQPALSYTGAASDGEVEDYAVDLIEYGEMKWQQPPDTLLPGLHATDGNILADDWICNGGVVTDIHWWGNYELGPGGVEKRGSFINHFLVNIYSNSSCLPNVLLKSYVVPFTLFLETNTGLTNNEGANIYKYDFLLPEPFIQIKDTTYWLSVVAVSTDPQNPPFWRWQEANRWLFPIHCGAAQNLGSIWQTITWPFPPLIKYEDLAFSITSWRLDTLYLQNIDVTTGEDNCYDATKVLIVAGGGTTFTVRNGARATMIAGEKISYLYGTTVQAGGYMHGYITTTGQFCSSLKTAFAANSIAEPTIPEMHEMITAGSCFKVYPNPTTGEFMLDLSGVSESENVSLEIYSMLGTRVLTETLLGNAKQTLSLAHQPPGIYILHVKSGKELGTIKIIKQ